MREVTSVDITVGDRTGNIFELSDGKLVCVSFSGCVVSVSNDGGVNWENKTSSIHPNANPRTMFVDSNNNLYFSKGLAGNSGILYRSTDAGETWESVLDTEIINPEQYSNALWFMCEDTSGNMYVNEYSFGTSPIGGWQALNVYKSTDGGNTWQTFYTHQSEIRHLHMVACDSSGNIYLSGAHPINGSSIDPSFNYVLDSVGRVKNQLLPINAGGGMCGMVETDNGSLIFSSDRLDGIWRLQDRTFVNVLDVSDWGLSQDNFLTIVKGRDGVLYTVSNSSEKAYVFASDDDGKTWIRLKNAPDIPLTGTTTITVGRGPTPYIYWDGGYLNNYRRMKDYTRAELRALYTSTLTIKSS